MNVTEVREQIARALTQANEALRLGICGQMDEAFDLVQTMADEIGPRAVAVAAATWCDRYIEHSIDGAHDKPIEIGTMRYVNASTGAMGGEVPFGVGWSGRVIAARAALDPMAFALALDEPIDGNELGECIGWLLQTVASTINGLPRGFATMGKDLDD